jgi:hypothetical protein
MDSVHRHEPSSRDGSDAASADAGDTGGTTLPLLRNRSVHSHLVSDDARIGNVCSNSGGDGSASSGSSNSGTPIPLETGVAGKLAATASSSIKSASATPPASSSAGFKKVSSSLACTECRSRWARGSSASAATSAAAPATYTVCDVSLHNTMEDCWITAYNNVYSLPVAWIKHEHPGGSHAFARHAGEICDVDFDFHSKGAQRKWDKFKIGTLTTCLAKPKLGKSRSCSSDVPCGIM